MTVPIYSRDVYAYLAQAEVFRAGFNPYSDGPVAPARTDARLHGPGVAAAQQRPTGRLSCGSDAASPLPGRCRNVILGVQLMRAVLIPGLLLSLWAVPAWPATSAPPPAGDCGWRC